MCMYTEQEFRNVRAEMLEDRHELRAAIEQLRHVIDRIRQQMPVTATVTTTTTTTAAGASTTTPLPPPLGWFVMCCLAVREHK